MKTKKQRDIKTINLAYVRGLFNVALEPQDNPFNFLEAMLVRKKGNGRMVWSDKIYQQALHNNQALMQGGDMQGLASFDHKPFDLFHPVAVFFEMGIDKIEDLFGESGCLEGLMGSGYSIVNTKAIYHPRAHPTYYAEVGLHCDAGDKVVLINAQPKELIINLRDILNYCKSHKLRLQDHWRFDYSV